MPTNQPLSDSNALPVIETVLGATPPFVLAGTTPAVSIQTEQWKALEERITAWAPDSDGPNVRADEDGYRLPTGRAVAVAMQVVQRLCEGNVGVPIRLGQTAKGGINFEWRSPNCTERLTVDARGEMELVKFKNSTLIFRKAISFASVPR